LSQLNALLKKSEKPDILGVILDADKDVNARYQNIKSKAKDKNLFLCCGLKEVIPFFSACCIILSIKSTSILVANSK
jgi:hypothetical protein